MVTHLLGGLGNQMFQYAAARALSLARGQLLRLDIGDFEGYRLHQGFELHRLFNIEAEAATPADLRHVLGWQCQRLTRRILAQPSMAAFRRKSFVAEPHFHYWPGIELAPSDCYLRGYWQSPKYFENAADILRKDFAFKVEHSRQNLACVERIRETNAISLHVRRGDYVQNPRNAAQYGSCTPHYYHEAIQLIAAHVPQPHFYVFSDDMEWATTKLDIPFPCEYVDCNQGQESYNDMRLMSLCRHHVIANSSFSWWGAWLNAFPDKIVIAPRQWFASGQKDATDLFAQGWITL